jgi:hypothetical protein
VQTSRDAYFEPKESGAMGFFEFGTPKDMLEKARREFKRLEDNSQAAPPDEIPSDDFKDHVFNFFVTAYHVADYLDEPLRKKVRKKSWLKLCGDVGNKAKHMELTRDRPDPKTPKHYTFSPGASVERSVKWCIAWPNGTSREVVSFAREVITKWERFFELNGI